MLVWARQRKPLGGLNAASRSISSRYWVNHPYGCALCLFLCLLLSSSAFFLPNAQLPILLGVCFILLIQGCFLGGKIKGLILLFSTQFVFTMLLYLLFHGGDRMNEGAIAIGRLVLAVIPGWWLSISCVPHRIGEVLSWFLPHKWAFVLAACFNLLPHLTREVREIYQMQVMRGARITPKNLLKPNNWGELAYCVLYPLLIQLLKLSKQMALAAQLRRFGQHEKPTHWPE